MKKFVAVFLALVLAFALAGVAFANPGQNPNQRPGGATSEAAPFTVVVTGGGNNLRIDIVDAQGNVIYTPRRAGNGSFGQTIDLGNVGLYGFSIDIRVQGNSLRASDATCLHLSTSRTVVSAPTCTTPGSFVYNCDICNAETDSGAIAAVGCCWGEWAVVTAASCLYDGLQRRVCYWYDIYGCAQTEVLPALGHDFGEWFEVTAPTCEEEGLERRDCLRGCCDYYETRSIPKLECDCVPYTPPTPPPCPGWGTTCGPVCGPCNPGAQGSHPQCHGRHHPSQVRNPNAFYGICGCVC